MPIVKLARRKPTLPVVPDDGFDALRRVFSSKEAGESASVTTLHEKLHATLTHAQQVLDCTLDEIRTRSHRLRGGAAILGFAKLAAAANTLEQAATAGVRQHASYEPQIGTAHVLLVEDDPAVRQATRMLLKVEGYRVTAVECLSEALQHARDGHSIDLLVTDYHLGNGELGTEVIAALRESLALPLKAVLMTGDTSTAVAQLPRDPYLRIASKPIHADELLTLLRALLAA
jgi:CheY-like chemotaxis protein